MGVLQREDAVMGRKRKPRRVECKTCKKGKKGKCKPAANGTPCAKGTCQGGVCTTPTRTVPPPVCKEMRESCAVGDCCTGLVCGDNACGEPVCCADVGASCGTANPCDCCGTGTSCQKGICVCGHPLCGGECLANSECCVSDECDGEFECIDGSCVCPGEFECGAGCCDFGANEVCKAENGTLLSAARAMVARLPTFVAIRNRYICGDAGEAGCACATSIGDQTICSDFAVGSCADCTSDTDCAAIAPDWVCIENTGGFCGLVCPGQNLCVAPGCPSTAPLGAEGRSRFGSLLTKGGAAVAAGKDTRSVAGTAKHVSGKRRAK